MASVCLGKATCQKWTARLHVRSMRACACVNALSPLEQRLIPSGRQSGLMVTTALFWQSNSATIFKSLRGQVYPNTVRNKQDIFEIFRLVTSVKFLRREGGSIDGKKTPQLPFSSKNRSPQHYLGILKRIPCKTKAKHFDRHYSENSKGVLSHLLQSNSHLDHPLRFAPNWFDDVMMTMCNRTVVKIGFSQLFTMAKHA